MRRQSLIADRCSHRHRHSHHAITIGMAISKSNLVDEMHHTEHPVGWGRRRARAVLVLVPCAAGRPERHGEHLGGLEPSHAVDGSVERHMSQTGWGGVRKVGTKLKLSRVGKGSVG